jgi:hypothetical protein
MQPSYLRLQILWQRLMAHCYVPSDEDYPHIGGMGVTMCDAWKTLDGFLAWALSPSYTDSRWLVRDDLHAPFAPDNCRWVSGREFRDYRERIRVHEAFEERKILADWLEDPRRRVTARQVKLRLQRGWPMERALSETARQPCKPRDHYTASQIPLGARFGRLTIIGPCLRHVYRTGAYAYRYDCRCDCGTLKNVNGSNLLTGDIVSCGCYRKEVTGQKQRTFNVKDPLSPDYRLYRIWQVMVAVCTTETHKRYPFYGGQGINVCVTWVRNYIAFRDWSLQQGYTGTEKLHRHNCAGDFSPENCNWGSGQQRSSPPSRVSASAL